MSDPVQPTSGRRDDDLDRLFESLASVDPAELAELARAALSEGTYHLRGQALYTDDIQLPGMLHGKFLRSPHAHARIVSIDTSRAEALPGVHGVLVGAELPTRYGVIPWTPDETALCVDIARFVGDEVAAVAAVDEDTANAALRLIDVEYEGLHAYHDPRESLERHDPAIHPGAKHGNVSKHVELAFGDVEDALAGSAHAVEDVYEFHGTAHAPIEPHCAVARVSGDGVITLQDVSQHLKLAQQ